MTQIGKKLFFVLAASAISILTKAQQDPARSNYIFDPLSINPAYAGYYLDPILNFSAKGFLQSMEGSPQTLSFSAHGKALNPKVGLGINLIHDEIGVTSNTGIYGNYSYKLVSRNHNSYTSWGFHPHVLAFGISAGVSFYNEDLQSLGIDDDPNFAQNASLVLPNFGVGIYYSKNKFFAGLSIPKILNNYWEGKDFTLSRHVYLNSGYQFITGQFTKLELSTLIKYVNGAPLQADGNVVFDFDDKVNIGVGYRTTSQLNFLLGIGLAKNFQLRYCYEVMLDGTSEKINFNNHEIMISYRFAK